MIQNFVRYSNPKVIGKWAIKNFIKIHQRDNLKNEEEISKFLFSKRYKSIFVTKELKKLSDENLPFITSIPALVYGVINMESKGGRTEKFKDLYLEGLGEMIKIYANEKKFPCELNKIIMTGRKISEMTQNSKLSKKARDNVSEIIIGRLIFHSGYRTCKDENELANYISVYITESERLEKYENFKENRKTELFAKYDKTDNLSRKDMISDLEKIGYDRESATLLIDEYILNIYPDKHYLFLEMEAENKQK